MPMQCCHWGRRCPKTEGRCPDQKESLSHGNPDSSQPLSQSHILMYYSLLRLPWDSIGYRLRLAVGSSMSIVPAPQERMGQMAASLLVRGHHAPLFAQNPYHRGFG